jgi:ribosomal protein S12 methylthiotransferase accessory factor
MQRTSLRPQVERLLDLISPRVGVIKTLTRVPRGADEPVPPILYQAVVSSYDFKNAQASTRTAAGKGISESDAIGGAIGEAIERYCAHHPALDRIKRVRRADLALAPISPDDLVLYSSSQYAREGFAYRRWTEDMEIGWLTACELPGGGDVDVPAGCTYLNYVGPSGEDYFSPTTSNGLAAGPDIEQATLSGLYELAERDGFLAHWMHRLPAPEVMFDRGIAAAIRTHYRRFGIETRVFNVSTDLPVYVIMAVSLGDGAQEPAALVGLGCHLDPNAALEKALFEICQIRPSERRRFLDGSACNHLKRYEDIKTLHDHSEWLMRPERRSELAFLLEHGRRQALADLPNRSTGNTAGDLEIVVNGMLKVGSRVAFADLTTADVRPYGIVVVRAFATGLQPMHFGHGEDRLGGRRLFELPRTLGYTAEVAGERDLNPCPHPLA